MALSLVYLTMIRLFRLAASDAEVLRDRDDLQAPGREPPAATKPPPRPPWRPRGTTTSTAPGPCAWVLLGIAPGPRMGPRMGGAPYTDFPGFHWVLSGRTPALTRRHGAPAACGWQKP